MFQKNSLNIYVWIFQNGVEFEAKLFRLPVGDAGRPLRCLKRQGAWLPVATIGGPQALSPGGGEGHRKWPFAQ